MPSEVESVNKKGVDAKDQLQLKPRVLVVDDYKVLRKAAEKILGKEFDVLVACIFGVIGYFMRTLNFSPAAAIIAFVLAPGAEQALRQSVLLTDDGFGIFLHRPVALVFFAIPVVAIGIRIIGRMRANKAQSAELQT